MLEAGAAIVDVGGESTRPGSSGVSAEEELARIEPVLADLAGAPVSVDTSKAEVARRALELGVELVNDVTALRSDPELAGVVAGRGLLSLPDAHAGRAAHDAGESRLRRRRLGREAVPDGATRVCGRPGRAGGARLPRSGNRLRQDGRPQLRAAAAVGRARRDRAAAARRRLAQELARADHGRPRSATGSTAASVGAAVSAYERGATILRAHDVRDHVEALAAARAVAG